ncbi:MAG: hypothetical protein KDC87_15635 [Planctomycetes bacterium]|nr:hypothetical protein [Planctomycetota bacterium]MCB9872368.1 hypothetical protein [Planctomycetota bacterium]
MRVLTLGPDGSCHQNAVRAYCAHHGVDPAGIELIEDFLPGVDRVRDGGADLLVACSAHLNIHLVTERYPTEVRVTDTFVFPTKDIVVLERAAVVTPRTLGSVRACDGYVADLDYAETHYEITKPVVGRKLLAGAYDAGVTTMDFHLDNPGVFRLRKHIGCVLTTWLVFGRQTTLDRGVHGVLPPGSLHDVVARPGSGSCAC